MASTTTPDPPVTPTKVPASQSRPGLRTTQSFPRQDVPDDSDPLAAPRRSNTFPHESVPEITVDANTSPQKQANNDAFDSERRNSESIDLPRASVDMDEIPIELISKADHFIDSLSAKVHPVPPNIDNLSRLFQDFYHVAATHIQTHIASLATRQTRDFSSPAPQPTSRTASAASILRAKAVSLGGKDKSKPAASRESEQQMLTPEEYADRRRARKALEQKRVLLEEAVERRLCEGIYDRIYRHRSTHDEAADDKLRSKTAALGLVGIGPADLGVDLGELPDEPNALANKHAEIRDYLEQARQDLCVMNEKRYPFGKLHYLKEAHKSIVNTLSHFHPSSSADEIMPMLIFTLITMPPEKLNVISDSLFIQRFRWEEKMEGESAYCLTNLEAAITFLETVDLASLRASEAQQGPAKSGSRPNTPPDADTTYPPAYTSGISATTTASPEASPENAEGLKPRASTSTARATAQRRRLSDLIQTPAQAIGTASDSIFTTADQGFKTIGTSLGDSYKFLLGKLRDTSADGKELVVPRTLDDARKLISTPPPEDDASVDGSGPSHESERRIPLEDRMLAAVVGKKAARDRSADSVRSGLSGSSSKKVAFAEEGKDLSPSPPSAAPSPSNPALVDSVRSFGSSLNPINRLSNMGLRGFGRSAPAAASPAAATPPPPPIKDAAGKSTDGGDLAAAFPDLAAALPPIPKVKPANKRFMEMQNPADLRLSEVLELLRDYRRLADALQDLDAFEK